MRTEPSIAIICDSCKEELNMELTPLARGAYDERDIDQQLKRYGWVITDEEDICPECTRDRINPSELGYGKA
ncbi:MAG: hypothetical protein A2163_00700 [Actinobacteria bacterium RBG_13_35_12]|nr:MAG: hypothetical protein A2163_00700 [Actinobacteria bacterium RBG_13_35_12]